MELEVWKLRRDPTELVTRAVQPMLWLLLFGEVFSRIRAIPTGNRPYLDFMAPGILAQSVLFVAIFYGIAVIWERDLGVVHKLMVTPTPRSVLVLGKALSAGVRGLSQAVIIYLLALVLKVGLSWNPLDILGVLLFVLIGAALFSTFSLIIATIVKTRERFMLSRPTAGQPSLPRKTCVSGAVVDGRCAIEPSGTPSAPCPSYRARRTGNSDRSTARRCATRSFRGRDGDVGCAGHGGIRAHTQRM